MSETVILMSEHRRIINYLSRLNRRNRCIGVMVLIVTLLIGFLAGHYTVPPLKIVQIRVREPDVGEILERVRLEGYREGIGKVEAEYAIRENGRMAMRQRR